MNPKKVWSIILIVLGVLFILGGINGCYEASFYGKEIESSGKLTQKYGGQLGKELFDVDYYEGIILKEKIKCVVFLLLGLAAAIGGTLMLKNSGPSGSYEIYDDGFELDSKEDGRWRL